MDLQLLFRKEGVNYLAISSNKIEIEEPMKLPGGVRVSQFSVITA